MKRTDVYSALDQEREYQDQKWGNTLHSVPGWLLILKRELDEAVDAWVTQSGSRAALEEIVQVAAVAVACLEQYGAVGRKDEAGGDG